MLRTCPASRSRPPPGGSLRTPAATRQEDRLPRGWLRPRRHGELVQVELDALPPDALHRLYEDAVAEYWDTSAYKAVVSEEDHEREQLAELVA